MTFTLFNARTAPLLKNYNIFKHIDIVNTGSCVFLNKYLNNNSFSIFTEGFKLLSAVQSNNIISNRNVKWSLIGTKL